VRMVACSSRSPYESPAAIGVEQTSATHRALHDATEAREGLGSVILPSVMCESTERLSRTECKRWPLAFDRSCRRSPQSARR